MECYFGSRNLPDNDLNGDKSVVVLFTIPEAGIEFKAPFAAVDKVHGDLAALLALLEFIDSNQKYFPNKTFQIYGDNSQVIKSINKQHSLHPRFARLLIRAMKYREKYRYSLRWTPAEGNACFESLFD